MESEQPQRGTTFKSKMAKVLTSKRLDTEAGVQQAEKSQKNKLQSMCMYSCMMV